jgi:hypothetical protein
MRNPPADRARFHLRIRHVSISGLGTFPTAGLHQRLLLHGAGRLKNNDIRGAQTHVRKSGGCQPAVGGQMRIGGQERRSSADRRRCACVCVDGRCNCVYRRHGGLTPPALVLQCERLPAKQRFLQCTNARSQERRASARRGNETHLQWRASFPGRVRSPTTAGLRQPLLLHGAGRLKNNDIHGAQTHIRQERRASARRGCE